MSKKAPQDIRDKMVAEYLAGKTMDEAAAVFGYSEKVCANALLEKGIVRRPTARRDAVSVNRCHEVVSDYAGGMLFPELCQKYNRKKASLVAILRAQGITVKRERLGRLPTIDDEGQQQIVKMYASGLSAQEVSKKYGCGASVVLRCLHRAGIKIRPARTLSPADIANIQTRYESGQSAKSIAPDFGVRYGCIVDALRDKSVPIRQRSCYPKYECNHNYFEKIDTEEKAYWLGFLAADGCISEHGSVIQLGLQARDREHVERFVRAVGGTHPVAIKENGGHPSAVVKMSSRKMAADLASHGITPRKTFTLAWPSHLTGESLRHFLRGYFDGDGGWTTRKRKEAQTAVFQMVGNREFIQAAQLFLMNNCSLNQTKLGSTSSPVVTVVYAGNNQCRRIAEYMYRDASVFMPRKLAKIGPFLSRETAIIKLTE